MALNIFGALGAIGRLLPGYVQGERQAIADNWNDLNQYNQVQSGQMQNAFDEAMFNPRLSMGYDAAANSRMGVYNNGMDLNVKRMGYPGAMQSATIGSMLGPQLYAQMLMGQLGQARAGSNLWWNPQSQNYWGNYGIPMMPGVGGGNPALNPNGGQQGWQGAWPWMMPWAQGPQQQPGANPPTATNP